jgi:deoxyribodipyrimidine photo-lyase
MDATYPTGLVWFRRDLRADDHAALSQALRSCAQVHCVFVLDTGILSGLPRRDRRVEFIRDSLAELDETLRRLAGRPEAGLIVVRGQPQHEIPRLALALKARVVFANHDYEPQAMARDDAVREALAGSSIDLHTFKDQAVFEHREVRTQAGTPYSVFTPYKKAWLARLADAHLHPKPVAPFAASLAPRPPAHRRPVPALEDFGFEPAGLRALRIEPGEAAAARQLAAFVPRLSRYHEARDFPAARGPSYLSVHLRFGTLSVRAAAAAARPLAQAGDAGAQAWLSELIWRDFYFQVLANFPYVADTGGTSHSFRPEYDAIAWETGAGAQARFAAWCEGRTGYPLVDAAMHQINHTGYMHNRLRMVTASFLTKDLGVDWRWGERYFAQQLNDFDLAANNGGWQWAASCGCDAQPWFRIFNPVSQSRKFDPEGKFILRYLPQLAGLPAEALHAPWLARPVDLAAAGLALGRDYPLPIVDHEKARQETLARYSVVRRV